MATKRSKTQARRAPQPARPKADPEQVRAALIAWQDFAAAVLAELAEDGEALRDAVRADPGGFLAAAIDEYNLKAFVEAVGNAETELSACRVVPRPARLGPDPLAGSR